MKSIPKIEVDKFIAGSFLRIQLDETTHAAITATFDAAYPFFRAPLQEKKPNSLPQDGGYRPYGIEYSQSSNVLDQIESFTASDRTRLGTNSLPAASARLLHKRMLVTFDALESIAEELTIRVAESITGGAFRNKLQGAMRRWSRLQLNYAKPANTKMAFINEAHEDGVLMTLVCATQPGFEAQMQDGEFIPLTTASGEVIALAGEITWLLSGGLVQPLFHRVRPVGDYSERLSLIFLGDIYPKLCEPWIKNEVNANIDVGERVLTSASRFGLQGFTGE